MTEQYDILSKRPVRTNIIKYKIDTGNHDLTFQVSHWASPTQKKVINSFQLENVCQHVINIYTYHSLTLRCAEDVQGDYRRQIAKTLPGCSCFHLKCSQPPTPTPTFLVMFQMESTQAIKFQLTTWNLFNQNSCFLRKTLRLYIHILICKVNLRASFILV